MKTLNLLKQFRNKSVMPVMERGQSLVEFAFAAIVLLILLAGVIDASRALFAFLAMRDGAQEGALYGSVHPDDTTGIEERVCNSSTFLLDMCNDPTTAEAAYIDIDIDGAACSGNAITVVVTVDEFPLVMPFIGVFVGGQSVPISTEVTNTILSPMCT